MRVCVLDPNPPLSLTSSYSTECYRDAWGDAPMQALIGRSIERLEQRAKESENTFNMNRNGYLFASTSSSPGELAQGALPAWKLRDNTGKSPETNAYMPNNAVPSPDTSCKFLDNPTGMDLLGQGQLQSAFPFLSSDVRSGVHARRCGWMDSQQMGMDSHAQARAAGVDFVAGTVTRVRTREGAGGRAVCGVEYTTVKNSPSGEASVLSAPLVINAAGPFCQALLHSVEGVSWDSNTDPFERLEMCNLLHGKALLRDPGGVLPRDSPMVIAADPVRIPWSDADVEAMAGMSREELAEELGPAWVDSVLDPSGCRLPAGCHVRPTNSGSLIFVWEHAHHHLSAEPRGRESQRSGDSKDTAYFDGPTLPDFYDDLVSARLDPLYPEMVVRAMATLVPGLGEYAENGLSGLGVSMDGGYYTQTRDLRPVIGPVEGVPGMYLASAFAGFGIMAAEGAAELVGALINGAIATTPRQNGAEPALKDQVLAHASAFAPNRTLSIESSGAGGGIGGSL